jgi:hypothetical protein
VKAPQDLSGLERAHARHLQVVEDLPEVHAEARHVPAWKRSAARDLRRPHVDHRAEGPRIGEQFRRSVSGCDQAAAEQHRRGDDRGMILVFAFMVTSVA